MAIARLLDTLDALGFIARHLHPPRLDALVATLGDRDAALREALAEAVWPAQLRDPIGRAAEATLRACDGLRAAAGSADGMRQAYRALRQVSRALEALYPLAAVLPTVNRFFLASDDRTVGATRDRCADRRDACPQRHQRARRFLGVCAGGLRSGARISAGDGAAWRFRAWQAVPVELAARGTWPRRDPGGADRDGRHVVADGAGRGQRTSRAGAGGDRTALAWWTGRVCC